MRPRERRGTEVESEEGFRGRATRIKRTKREEEHEQTNKNNGDFNTAACRDPARKERLEITTS